MQPLLCGIYQAHLASQAYLCIVHPPFYLFAFLMSQNPIEEPIPGVDAPLAAEQAEVLPAETAVEQDTQAADPQATLQAEVDKWKDMALRNAAELDNYRKRVTRDMQETRSYGNSDLLRELFPILDNFEMGLDAARAENEKSMIFMGLSMVKRQLSDFLRNQNVEEITPTEGTVFDPNLHDAVSQEAHASIADGGIIRVSRRGYKLKDRLLRPATVVVSSGPATA